MHKFLTRRQMVKGAAGSAAVIAAAGIIRPARAATKVRFLTSWFAEAEHGGFYQALATGLYEKAGLDVEIKMGGPQVNAIQLLAAGETDLMMGYDIQVLTSIEKGLPVTTVGAAFQFDLQGIMTHDDVKSLADLKNALPKTWGSPTMSPHCGDEVKYGIVDKITAQYKDAAATGKPVAGQKIRELITVNGVRVVLEDGTWGLVRASSNKPELVIVVESPTAEANMRAIFADIDARLAKYPEVGEYNQKI